jgi:hypothetical protein
MSVAIGRKLFSTKPDNMDWWENVKEIFPLDADRQLDREVAGFDWTRIEGQNYRLFTFDE